MGKLLVFVIKRIWKVERFDFGFSARCFLEIVLNGGKLWLMVVETVLLPSFLESLHFLEPSPKTFQKKADKKYTAIV